MERYLNFANYCTSKYGRKLYRVALDAHMTCPNRDGTKGNCGCIFCDEGGSGDFAISYDGQRLTKEDLIYNHQEAGVGDYIAYFQAYTNTYAPIDKLTKLFSSALEDPLFAGISIATRPDCLPQEVIDLLKQLKQNYPNKFIWVELGLQSIHEQTAIWMRRGYPLQIFDEAVKQLKKIGVEVIVHTIIGLYQEDKQMMIQTIEHLNTLHIDGIKLQLLHYLKDTDLGKSYLLHPKQYHVLTLEEYVDIIVTCIGHLNENIVVNRLTGDGNRELLIEPQWSLDKRKVINEINHALKQQNITQGCLKGGKL